MWVESFDLRPIVVGGSEVIFVFSFVIGLKNQLGVFERELLFGKILQNVLLVDMVPIACPTVGQFYVSNEAVRSVWQRATIRIVIVRLIVRHFDLRVPKPEDERKGEESER